jgi:hypothetical protein
MEMTAFFLADEPRGGSIRFFVGAIPGAAGKSQPFLFFLLDQAGKRVTLKGGHHFVADFLPGAVHGAEEIPFAAASLNEALVEGQGAFFGLDHIEQGDFHGVLGQIKTAAYSSLRADNAILDEGLENLGEKGRSDILGLADILLEYDFAPGLFGQVEQGANGIFGGSGYEHG